MATIKNDLEAFLYTHRNASKGTKKSSLSDGHPSVDYNDYIDLPPPLPGDLAKSFRPHLIFSSCLFLGGMQECKFIPSLRRSILMETQKVLKRRKSDPAKVPARSDDNHSGADEKEASVAKGASDDGAEDRREGVGESPRGVRVFLVVSAIQWPKAQLQLRRVTRRAAASDDGRRRSSQGNMEGSKKEMDDTLLRSFPLTQVTKFYKEKKTPLSSEDVFVSAVDWKEEVERLQLFLLKTYSNTGKSKAVSSVDGEANFEDKRPGKDSNELFRYYMLCVPADDFESFSMTPFMVPTALLLHAVAGLGKRGVEAGVHSPAAVVHCLVGRSRSATLVAASLFLFFMQHYTHAHTGIDRSTVSLEPNLAAELVDAILRYIQEARPIIQPNPGFHKQLIQLAQWYLERC